MGNIQHAALDYTETHVPFSYSYANSTAREGDTGFVSADLGKLALQTDNNSLWLLTATTPTWAAAIITGSITVDTILEDTPGAGVTIDGVLCKDNSVTATGGFIGDVTGALTGTVTGFLDGNVRSSNSTVVLNSGTDGTDATLTLETFNTSGTGISGTAIKDEDDMTSDSDIHLASQQSIKAYIDAQITSLSAPGTIQAWVSFDISGNILDSYNVASVTTPSTGIYTVTFTSALSNTNYAALATSNSNTTLANTGGHVTTGLTIRTVFTTTGALTAAPASLYIVQ